MAHKPKSFKLDEKKKEIIIYTNVEQEPSEKILITFYLENGYKPKFDEKKPAKTVKQMRAELKQDLEMLDAFDAAYGKPKGFFEACKVYNAWKKQQKKNK